MHKVTAGKLNQSSFYKAHERHLAFWRILYLKIARDFENLNNGI
jgi:hypothetical protein